MPANFTVLCLEALANLTAANPEIANDTSYRCNGVYSDTSAPSAYIAVSLDVCMARMPGIQLSDKTKLTQWAGPFVSFLVPALGFIFFIPREWNLTELLRRHDNERKWATSLMIMAGSFFLFILDMLLGYAVVFAWAGPFIAGAVHEAFVDGAILNEVRRANNEARHRGWQARLSKWYAVAVTLVGSYRHATIDEDHNRTFADMVLTELRETRDAHIFLRRLSAGVTSFGTQVGIPMLFYLSSTLYGIVDAEGRRGDNDTAHSIAFGLWYFVIVVVAIASSLILGVSSPKILESIFNDYHVNHSVFKLRWLDERRIQLWEWSLVLVPDTPDNCENNNNNNKNGRRGPPILGRQYTAIIHRYVKRSCLIAGVILALPCILAVVVSYTTPNKGFSCRSTTVLTYIIAQEVLIMIWYFRSSPSRKQTKEAAARDIADGTALFRNRVVYWSISALSFLYHSTGVLSVGITVGGTIMQLVGVYRNCICKAGLFWGLPTTKSWEGAMVKVADDTLIDRQAASVWLVCGFIGIGTFALVSLFGAWHSTRMRQRCAHIIDELYRSEEVTTVNTAHNTTELTRLTVSIPQSTITW